MSELSEREEAIELAKRAGWVDPERAFIGVWMTCLMNLIRVARQSAPCPHTRSGEEWAQPVDKTSDLQGPPVDKSTNLQARLLKIAYHLDNLVEMSPANTGPDPAPEEPLTARDHEIGLAAHELRQIVHEMPDLEDQILMRKVLVELVALKDLKDGGFQTSRAHENYVTRKVQAWAMARKVLSAAPFNAPATPSEIDAAIDAALQQPAQGGEGEQ